MAYTTSGQLPIGSDYQLGEYTVSLSAQLVPIDNSIYAYSEISDSSGKIDGKGVNIPFGFTAKNWYIEATENDLSVYVNVETYDPYDDAADHYSDDNGINAIKISYSSVNDGRDYAYTSALGYDNVSGYGLTPVTMGSRNVPMTLLLTRWGGYLWVRRLSADSDYTYMENYAILPDGRYRWYGTSFKRAPNDDFLDLWIDSSYSRFAPIYTLVPESTEKPGTQALHPVTGKRAIVEYLVARFPINLGYAGGGSWIDPGDWNPDPYKSLHVTVNGALSGRHNDPLNDTSFSYVPANKATAKSRGCGGDGGHGGGGGAGASTIIVNHFATGKANYKDINANAKRHGYGSGGGKGGTGGDGCIIVYY